MAVSNELTKPENESDFEAMCHALYRRMWNDSSCSRVGGPGQSQFGIDIHGRPQFAKLSFDDFELVKIAAIHPDFI